MTEPASIADIHAIAGTLPRGHRDRGDGETMQADMYLSYEAGDDVWEFEYCALDPARNFVLQERLLADLLDRVKERVWGDLA